MVACGSNEVACEIISGYIIVKEIVARGSNEVACEIISGYIIVKEIVACGSHEVACEIISGYIIVKEIVACGSHEVATITIVRVYIRYFRKLCFINFINLLSEVNITFRSNVKDFGILII
jgi:hypothetical protein